MLVIGSSALVFTKILKQVHESQTQKQNQEIKHLHSQHVFLILGGIMTSLGW